MPAERYYIAQEFSDGSEIELEGVEFHHFANVMRGKAGDQVELVNGRGSLAVASVLRVEKKKAIVGIENVHQESQCRFQLILAQAIPRLNRLDFIVEKATELGMTELWLFPGERSERKELTESQLERLQSVCVAAMKQCGRLFLPAIVMKPVISKWEAVPQTVYFGQLSPTAPLLLDAFNITREPKIVFCTGPESGFTEREEESLIALGATGVKLHIHILRTDTASLAALALLSHRLQLPQL